MEPILPEPNAQAEQLAPIETHESVSSTYVGPENRPNVQTDNSGELPAVPVAHADPSAQTYVASVSDPGPVTQPDPAQQTSGPLVADDVDVIEKEWVDKAKQIVSATQGDPHQQEKDVSKLQADYLQKRYNKTVKLSE